jgi:hypothetical protein
MHDSIRQIITGIDQKIQIAFKDKTKISNRNSSIADFCFNEIQVNRFFYYSHFPPGFNKSIIHPFPILIFCAFAPYYLYILLYFWS